MKVEKFKGQDHLNDIHSRAQAGKGDRHASRLSPRAWYEAEYWKRREERIGRGGNPTAGKPRAGRRHRDKSEQESNG